jgi:hypothetical protein
LHGQEGKMLNEPRAYRHSPYQIGLIVLVFGILVVGLLTTISWRDYLLLIPLAGLFGIVFLAVLYSMTMKTTISDNEISTQSILVAKSLAWNEISRVSGRGNAIKLHNNLGDVTVAPSPQLPGYEEVINWIGIKRPDLFNPLEYGEMSRSWLSAFLLPALGLLFFGVGYFIFTQSSDTFFPLLVFTTIGVVFLGMMFASVQAVSIQGGSIVISYLFNRRTVSAAEIAAIDLRYTQTRNGKHYFVALDLVNKRTIRVSGLSPSLPVVFLVLRNWHKQNAAIGLTN